MKTCGAKTRDGDPCKNAQMANGRCRMHGGKVPRGIALPQTKTGKYSQHLPTRMLSAYEASREDPDLLALTAELNVTDAFLIDLHERLKANDADSWRLELLQTLNAFKAANLDKDAVEAREQMNLLEALIVAGASVVQSRNGIQTWQEHRRKLSEAETKRREKMQQMVSAEQAMFLVAALTRAVRDHVHDPDILRKITEELDRIAPSIAA